MINILRQCKTSTSSRVLLAVTLFFLGGIVSSVQANALNNDSILDLSLEDLLTTTITSVSKKKQNIKNTAASVYVISNEQIRRSGYTTVPDLLRMVPGLQVAQIDGNSWAISSRGFNGLLANKLLVMLDNRTLYNPVYSGTYWDVQDLVLNDIDRIEVIRGPGASVWGANAVNGVINIVSKTTQATQGNFLSALAGNNGQKSSVSLRSGFKLNDSITGRVYLKKSESDSNKLANVDADANDDGESLYTGFRFDGQATKNDRWSVHGDFYDVSQDQINIGLISPFSPAQIASDDRIEATGWNIMTNWQHQHPKNHGEAGFSSLQFFYDKNKRDELVLELEYSTLDIEFLNRFMLFPAHEITWGLGYRHIWDEYENTFRVSLSPDKLDYWISNTFIQDQIALTPELQLTFGAKLELRKRNKTEFQPSIRFHWTIDEFSSFWASLSRAVRTPSRFENNGKITAALIPVGPPPPAPTQLMPITIEGSPSYRSEELTALEAGYRNQITDVISIDISLFHNEFHNGLSYESNGFGVTTFDNLIEGDALGMELSSVWRLKEWWQLSLGYSAIQLNVEPKASSQDQFSKGVYEGNAPTSQVYISSSMNLINNWELDVSLQYVGQLDKTQPSNKSTRVASYTNIDAKLSWKPQKNIRLSVVGRNLLDNRHLEYIGQSYLPVVEISRSMYAQVEILF